MKLKNDNPNGIEGHHIVSISKVFAFARGQSRRRRKYNVCQNKNARDILQHSICKLYNYRMRDLDDIIENITNALDQSPDLITMFTMGDTTFGFYSKT